MHISEVEWMDGEAKKHLGMVDISVIIPAYNERNRIIPTIRQFEEVISASGMSYELLIVDDGSTDDTRELIQDLSLENVFLRLITYKENRGKGYAVKKGMLASTGKICVLSDADGSTSPDQVFSLIRPILNDKIDIAIGSRYTSQAVVEVKQPLYRIIWSRMASQLIRSTLLPQVKDAYCGFKAYKGEVARDLFQKAKEEGWTFDVEVLSIAHKLGYNIKEVPVRWMNDEDSRVKKTQFLKEMKSLWNIKRSMSTFQ